MNRTEPVFIRNIKGSFIINRLETVFLISSDEGFLKLQEHTYKVKNYDFDYIKNFCPMNM